MRKKISILVTMFAVSVSSYAQTRANEGNMNKESRAIGDTILYMPFVDIIVNPTDAAGFMIAFEDLDGLTPAIPLAGFNFEVYYSTNDTLALLGEPVQNNFYHPWESPINSGGTDSAFFLGSNSSFFPVGTADNWFEFGPITIPATGARMYWYDRTFDNRDGYEVRVSTSGMNNYSDFTTLPLFSESDGPSPSPTYTTDTTWELKSVAIPSWYNGTQLYFAFHHNATNMNYLFIDEISIVEDTVSTPGACSAAFSIVQDTNNLYNYTIYSSASVGSSYQYLWDFGDTTYAFTAYPTHLYTGSGPYQICLFVNDTVTGCSTFFCDTIIPGMWPSASTTITVVPFGTGVEDVLANNEFEVFPNPVSTVATIQFDLLKNQPVEIFVTDLLGKKIATLKKQNMYVGRNEFHWNPEGIRDGMYLIQLCVGEKRFTKKIIVSQQ